MPNTLASFSIPKKLPFLWKLAFLLFILGGLIASLIGLSTFGLPEPGEALLTRVETTLDLYAKALPEKINPLRQKILKAFEKIMPAYNTYIWKWHTLEAWIQLLMGLAMILGGFLGFYRKSLAYYLCIGVLLISIPLMIISYIRFLMLMEALTQNDDTLAAIFQFSYDFEGMIVIVLISLLHLWIAHYLWQRQHWFNG